MSTARLTKTETARAGVAAGAEMRTAGTQTGGGRALLLSVLMVLAGLLAMPGARADNVMNFGDDPPAVEGAGSVEDADATGGVAWKSDPGYAGPVGSGYSWETMGQFEATFRMKVAANTATDPVVTVSYICETQKFESLPKGVWTSRALKGTDFKAAGEYQDFTVQWVSPWTARNGWQISVTGLTEVWIDKVTVREVKSMTETELLQYLPDVTPPKEPRARVGRLQVHLLRGYFSDYFQLDAAMARLPAAEVTSSSFAKGNAMGAPNSEQAVYEQDLIVLAGSSLGPLSLQRRASYAKWVEAGGSLLVIGGPQSFAEGRFGESIIGNLLPVELKPRYDLRRDHVLLTPPDDAAKAHPALAGIDFAPPMAALYRHEVVAVKPGGTVLLGTAEAPLLVVGEYGKGRVACWLAPPMGDAADVATGETAFWNDARTPALLAGVSRWLITRPAPPEGVAWQPSPTPGPGAEKALTSLSSGGLDDIGADIMDLVDDNPTAALTGETTKALKLRPGQLNALVREGGRPAVAPLLSAMADMIEPLEIRRSEWAIRPFVKAEDFDTLAELANSMSIPVRESALALMGKADPKRAADLLKRRGKTEDNRLLRGICRSANEGQIRSLIPWLKTQQARLKPLVNTRRLVAYEGYWFAGVQLDDPLFPYAEATLALVAMGEPGYLKDAADVLFLMHIQDIKMRSFLFMYNPKVPKEADAMERHSIRNQFLRPDLLQLMQRYQDGLGTLPPALAGEFRDTVLAIDDYEALHRLLYPAEALIAANPDDPDWRAFAPLLHAHTLTAAMSTPRF